jgi:bacterioferritin
MAMRGDTKVIEYLNAVLKGELTAVNQYWLHYRLLDNLGIKKLAEYERHESIDEMKHADKLMARIFFLDGLPGMQALNRLRIGENLPEVLQADLELEHEAVALLKDAIAHCEAVRDYPSRDLLAEILAAEEEHVDFIETQKTMIEQMGLQNYIQLQSEAAGS